MSKDTEVRNLGNEEELTAEQVNFDAAPEARIAASAEKVERHCVSTNEVERLAWLNFKSKSRTQTDSAAKSVAMGRIDPENESEMYIGRRPIWKLLGGPSCTELPEQPDELPESKPTGAGSLFSGEVWLHR